MENIDPKKKTPGKGRGTGFLPHDDKQLAKSWVAVSEDPVKGTDQTKELFWAAIKEHGEFMSRTPESLRQRWGTISRAVSKFSGIMSTISNQNQSGTTNEDKLDKALQIYKQDEKKDFKLLECFEVLSRCPKFKVCSEGKGITTTASPNMSPATTSDTDNTGGSPSGRPTGRDKSKSLQLVASLEARRAEALERIAAATEEKTKVLDEYRKVIKHQNYITIANSRLDDLDPVSRKILILEKKRVLHELTIENNKQNVDLGTCSKIIQNENHSQCSTQEFPNEQTELVSSNSASQIFLYEDARGHCSTQIPTHEQVGNQLNESDDEVFQKYIEIDDTMGEEENFSEN